VARHATGGVEGTEQDMTDPQRSGLREAGGIVLEDRQVELLRILVEAHRRVQPPEEFLVLQVMSGDPRDPVSHRGLTDDMLVTQLDLRALARVGLIDLMQGSQGVWTFSITPRAIQYYIALHRQGQPAERVEQEARRYIDSDGFKSRYAAAYAKWEKAEGLLWAADAQSQLTAIGHHCREAVQDFATELIAHHRPPDVDPDPTKTKNRLRATVSARRSVLGEKVVGFLTALVDYWDALVDLQQRQEHGAQREGHPLTWEDGRRAVFQTLIVMSEVDAALSTARKPT